MAVAIIIEPLDPVAGTRVTLRVAAGDDPRLTGLDDEVWWPGVVEAPKLSREVFDGNFTANAQLAAASFRIRLEALRKLDSDSPVYRWAGAPVTVWIGDADDDFSLWTERFNGLVDDYSIENEVLAITARVDGDEFEVPVLPLSYAGTGGYEGVEDLKDKSRPLCIGRALNVEPVQIDTTNYVFQVHGYGEIEAIVAVYERAADFVLEGGSNVGDFASYAALVAATIPEGSFGTCLAQGLFRLGAPPNGLITADVDGDNVNGFVRSTADIIERLCDICDVDAARLNSASFAALDTAVPHPASLYVTSPVKLIDLVQNMARACNAQAGVSWTGKLEFSRFGSFGTAALTLDAQGRQLPPVIGTAELKTSPPYWRLEMQGRPNWTVQLSGDIAYAEPPSGGGGIEGQAVSVYRRSPVEPSTPTGGYVPTDWLAIPPGYVAGPDFGPVWRSDALTAGGTVSGSWSEPVIDDSDWRGWVIKTTNTPGNTDVVAYGKTRAVKRGPQTEGTGAAADTFDAFYWVDQAIAGGFSLRFRVPDVSALNMALGVMATDPATLDDDEGNYEVIDYGVMIQNGANEGLFGTDGVFGIIATNYDFFGRNSVYGFFTSKDKVAAAATNMTIDMRFDGQAMSVYADGELLFQDLTAGRLIGKKYWPVIQLMSPDAEVIIEEWLAAPSVRANLPIADQKGYFRFGDDDGVAHYIDGVSPSGTSWGGLTTILFNVGLSIELVINQNDARIVVNFYDTNDDPVVGYVDWRDDGIVEVGSISDLEEFAYSAGDRFTVTWKGHSLYLFQNGALLKKVLDGRVPVGGVYAWFNFDANAATSVFKVSPLDETEEQFMGGDDSTSLTSPVTQATPTVSGSYYLLSSVSFSVGDVSLSSSYVAVQASMTYDNDSGSAVNYTPDVKAQWRQNGGSWTNITGAADIGPAATPGGASQTVSIAGIFVPSDSASVEVRFLGKNSIAGTYSATTSGRLDARWLK